MIGQQLANFRVERLIGQGGMAAVYLGQDVKLQRPVAVKVIDKRYKNDPAYAARFVKEARMMAKWRHENLIQIYYADDTKEYSYYVMEYVDGSDLSTVMEMYADEGELMPIEDVLRIGNAVAGALDYAHSQGVIHRDIKPSNVLIADDGRVLVGDFGMALEVRDGSMGNIFGTPHYISPEQARRSADAVPQSDLYSLGVILYEILTGSVPFNDPSPASIALQHISQTPPSLRSINPEITPAVEAVILKALEKNPQNRYQSGAKLMAALDEAFKATGSSPKMPLPALPVGVPTIKRNISLDQITKHRAPKVKGNTIHRPVELPPTMRAANQPQKKSRWGYALLALLLLLGIGGWSLAKSGFLPTNFSPAPTLISPLPSTDEPAQPTPTLIPASATPIPVQPSVAPTSESSSPVTPSAIPTVKYRDGNHITLFWNKTSFHLLNRSSQPRSLSGFSFERLDENGKPTDRFPGHLWENQRFNYVPSKYCVSIKIYQDEDPPYIDPPDCHGGYVSIIQPRQENAELFFWTPKEGSLQFRVIWVGEEVARCEISAGICEVFIP